MKKISIAWFSYGVGGLSAIAGAQATDFSFIKAVDQVTIGSEEFSLGFASQVVVQNGGHIAAIVDYSNDFNDGTSVIYWDGTGDASPIATVDSAVYPLIGSSTPEANFDAFYNLSLSRDINGIERVTFLARRDDQSGGGTSGVYQYNVNAATENRILGFADPAPPSGSGETFSFHPTSGVQSASYQVNNAGNALFSGRAGGDQVLIRGNETGTERLVDSTDSGLSNIDGFNPKKVLTGGNQAVFLADDGSNRIIAEVDSAGGSVTTRVQFPDGPSTIKPEQIFGATATAEVFGVSLDGTNDNALYYHNDSTNTFTQLGSTFNGVVGGNPTNYYGSAAMTQAGNVAFLTPNSAATAVESISYFDGSIQTLIASLQDAIIDPILGTLQIEQISLTGFTPPMLNDNGWVVFDAILGNGSPDYEALLAWNGGDLSLVARVGGEILIDGNLVEIEGFSNFLGSDGDVLKDGLSDDNYLAFGVSYADGHQIVVTQLPEPSGLMLLSVGLFGLCRRRRRGVPARR